MQIVEQDLCYTDYKWNNIQENKTKKAGLNENKIIDFSQGHDVMNLINTYMKKNQIEDKFAARKIEIMIREELPRNINKKNEILKWIEMNW
ncbi:MAG: hypothetical protein KDC05_15555 [Bacteroidales bacterium]|nr:hypothetical protein [Bacteroidales bacterium]